MIPLPFPGHLLPGPLRPFLVPGPAPSGQSRRLAEILGVGPGELGAIRLGRRYYYRPRTVAKPGGGERRLLVPSPALKQLQRRLLDGYLARLPVDPAATAFRPGGSAARHARAHALGRVVATVDLRDFFESTRAGRVRAFFRAQGWRDEALGTLMRLCVCRDGLPQGAPTSPCLSNLVNARLDERLRRLARRSGAAYTRYGDDLAFSWADGRPPGHFTRAAEDLIRAEGYEVQPRKGWQVRPARARPVVTGLVLAGDGRVRLPWPRRLRLHLLAWRAWWSGDPADAARLRGHRAHARTVDP